MGVCSSQSKQSKKKQQQVEELTLPEVNHSQQINESARLPHTISDHVYNFQQIKFPPLTCQYSTHGLIQGLCLRQECNKTCSVCSMCVMDGHKDCSSSIKSFSDILQLLQTFEQIQSQAIELTNRYTQELINQIEQIFNPIYKYCNNPNLDNLNQLGIFLRQAGIWETKLNILLDQCKQEINNFKEQQMQDLFSQGVVLGEQNKYQEAINCYKQVILIDPNQANAWNNTGVVLEKQMKYEEANYCYKKAILIDKNMAIAWNNLKEYMKYEEANYCYEKAMSLDQKYFDAWFYEVQIITNYKYPKPIYRYEYAIQINPLQSSAKNNIQIAENQ